MSCIRRSTELFSTWFFFHCAVEIAPDRLEHLARTMEIAGIVEERVCNYRKKAGEPSAPPGHSAFTVESPSRCDRVLGPSTWKKLGAPARCARYSAYLFPCSIETTREPHSLVVPRTPCLETLKRRKIERFVALSARHLSHLSSVIIGPASG